MCFSNLPIKFDDEGNPYLADEADEVENVPTTCGCGADAEDVPLAESDPEAVYEDVLAAMPSEVRERVADRPGDSGGGRQGSQDGGGHERTAGREQSAGGD